MTEPGDSDDEPVSGPINPRQAAMLINQLNELAQIIYYYPPQDVDCAVSYEDGSSYYRIDLRWKAAPSEGAESGSITDVDAFLRTVFNTDRGNS